MTKITVVVTPEDVWALNRRVFRYASTGKGWSWLVFGGGFGLVLNLWVPLHLNHWDYMIGVCAACVAVGIFQYYGYCVERRLVCHQGLFTGLRTYWMDSDAIHVEGPEWRQDISWSLIRDVVATPKHLFVLSRDASGFVIPMDEKNRAEVEMFSASIRSYLSVSQP